MTSAPTRYPTIATINGLPSPFAAPKAWSDHNIFWGDCLTLTECTAANSCRFRSDAPCPTITNTDEIAPCLRCNGTGTVFHATCGNSRSGEIEGYDDDCPQCGGSGEDDGR